MAGMLITFEGIEGSGKSTQQALLAARLREMDVPVLCTREPGGTELGEGVRRLVLEPAGWDIDPVAELLLMEAARAQHVAERVRPALADGKVVLCDRYTDSTVAYQGFGRGLDVPTIDRLNRLSTGDLRPDATVLLDLDVRAGLARTMSRGGGSPSAGKASSASGRTRFDMEEEKFHEAIRAGFLYLAGEEPDRIKVVAAAGVPEEVHARVWTVLEPALRTLAT